MSEDVKSPEDSGSVPSNCSSCRQQFEQWISDDPYGKPIERYPNDPQKFAWPGVYKDINTDLAWHAWQEAWKRGSAEGL